MILCSCTGLNTATLEEAVNAGASRIKDIYDLASSKSGVSSRCGIPEQVIQCTTNVAQAWKSYAGASTPPSVLKIADKEEKIMSKENETPCQNNCPGCTCSQKFSDEAQVSLQGRPVEVMPYIKPDKQSVKLNR